MLRYIKESAEYLVSVLKDKGYVIQYYESKTTNSIYMKLDYGVAGSIRLSDHIGKAKLRYTFNVLDNVTARDVVVDRGVQRYFYSYSDLDLLISDVEQNKWSKMEKFGTYKYKYCMEQNRKHGEKSTGFWSRCVMR